LLAQKPWIVPIPGTTKLNRLKENNNSASIDFTPDELREIDNASLKIKVQGERYPEQLQKIGWPINKTDRSAYNLNR
jgi:diketogulonate reductase-like aldo/keto reductase